MNLRKNSLTDQVSFEFKWHTARTSVPFFTRDLFRKVKNALTTPSIIDIWNFSLWEGEDKN